MKAQCSICSELFVIDQSVAIAAVPCGHTFHRGCLSTWLQKSNTCPSCRSRVDPKRVINRLYFDLDDDSGNDETEEWKLKTKVKSLKAKLKTVKKERDEAKNTVMDLESEKKNVESELRKFKGENMSKDQEIEYLMEDIEKVEKKKEELKRKILEVVQMDNEENE
ncbi:E3 ubiquitin-protein ligase TRAIP-like [Saccostrea cucullata]|uniref:E3 ubiquitin-protein ligase TRAIP-like n=1 Tax=Saccostrea cuccullata TaxID=36930 RepID=UPI002ED31303